MIAITKHELNEIDDLVKHYKENINLISDFQKQLEGVFADHRLLRPLIHSTRFRLKDPKHLRDKLKRKLIYLKKQGKYFNISEDNLFQKINDLVGIRIIHLHTRQIKEIDIAIRKVFKEGSLELLGKPEAIVWDDESRSYYEKIGFKTRASEQLYTSVHYIVKANNSSGLTAEVQVRTLSDELWGEVDHTINYPHRSSISCCREQIKVLARVTSSASRLVDSIFKSNAAGK